MKKHLFIDMDGTITCFENERGRVVTRNEEFTEEFFRTREPLVDMIRNIMVLFPEEEYEYHILSNCPNISSCIGKNAWLDEHFRVKNENRHFLFPRNGGFYSKSNFIVDYCFENNISTYDCVIIDDTIQNLIDCETISVSAWHPSKVLCKGRKLRGKNG